MKRILKKCSILIIALFFLPFILFQDKGHDGENIIMIVLFYLCLGCILFIIIRNLILLL